MPPRKSVQRTSRKRQRQASVEEAEVRQPLKDVIMDENIPPAGSRKKVRKQAAKQKPAPVQSQPVLCRQDETSRLHETLVKCIKDDQGGAIYIPGQPGTGKTHTVRAVVSALATADLERPLPACVLVNCQDASSSLPRVCLGGLREAQTVMCTFNNGGTCSIHAAVCETVIMRTT